MMTINGGRAPASDAAPVVDERHQQNTIKLHFDKLGMPLPTFNPATDRLRLANLYFTFSNETTGTAQQWTEKMFGFENRQIVVFAIACTNWAAKGCDVGFKIENSGYQPLLDRVCCGTSVFQDVFQGDCFQGEATRIYMHYAGQARGDIALHYSGVTVAALRASALPYKVKIRGTDCMCVPIDTELGKILVRYNETKKAHERTAMVPVGDLTCFAMSEAEYDELLEAMCLLVSTPQPRVLVGAFKCSAHPFKPTEKWSLSVRLAVVYSLVAADKG